MGADVGAVDGRDAAPPLDGDTPHSSAIMLQAAAPARSPALATPPASFAAAANTGAGLPPAAAGAASTAPAAALPATLSLTPPPVALSEPDLPPLTPPTPTTPLSARSAASSAARIAHVTAMTGASAAAIAGAYASPLLSASSSALRPPPPSSQIAHRSWYAACCAKGVSCDAKLASSGADADTGPSTRDCGKNRYRSVSTTLDAARAASQPPAHANPHGTIRHASETSRNQKSKTIFASEKTPSAVAISPRRVSATRKPACVAAADSENHAPRHAAAGAHRLIRIHRGRAAAGYAQLRAPVPAKCAATSAPRTAPKRAACTSPVDDDSATSEPPPPHVTAPRRSATHEAAPERTCAANAIKCAMASFASAAGLAHVGDGVAHHREGPNPAGKRCGGTRLAANRPWLPGSAKPP